METINQITQEQTINTTIADSNIKDASPQSAEDVETEDSNSIQQSLIENEHSHHKTLQEHEIETTNNSLSRVEHVDENVAGDEKSMDIKSTDDCVDGCKDNQHDTQQVAVSAEPQYQPQPQNEDEQNNHMSDYVDGGERITIKSKTNKHHKTEETEEDELLKSDNEEDNIEGVKKHAIAIQSITQQQEEELLKSEDENDEEEIIREKEKLRNIFLGIDDEERISDENKKINVIKNKEKLQNSTQLLDEANESSTTFENHNDDDMEGLSKEISSFENLIFKRTNEVNNHNETYGYNKSYKPKSSEHCKEESYVSESKANTDSRRKVRKNTENHRILYKFDLDDESSSEDSFQHKNCSSPTQASNDNIENSTNAFSTNDGQFFETDFQSKIENIEDESSEENNEKIAKKTQISYSHNHVAHLSEDDDVVSDNETENSKISSPRIILDQVAHINSEERKENIVAASSESPQYSPKNDESSSDEENYKEQDDEKFNEVQESIRKYSDSPNLRTDNSYISNTEIDEKLLNETTVNSNISSSNSQPPSNDRNLENIKENEHNLNGDHDSENENDMDQIANFNDNDAKNEKIKLLKSPTLSLELNDMSLSPNNSSSFNLVQTEESRSGGQKDVTDVNISEHKKETMKVCSDYKMEIESDNDSNLKIAENSQDYRNHDSNDNEEVNNKNFTFSPPLVISNEEGEVSRSSLASSASYSSNTSSSQHLVIDHPMDDIKEEKVKPLKISLKRKLSNLSDDDGGMDPKKKLHLDDENEQTSHFNEQKSEEFHSHQNTEITENANKNYQYQQMEEVADKSNIPALENSEEKASLSKPDLCIGETLSSKSLLMQQLERPPITSNILTNLEIETLTSSLITNTPTHILPPSLPIQSVAFTHLQSIPPTAPPTTGITKYLCFKCKTGSFETLASLTEHQITCLVSHNLFPITQTANEIRQLPPTSLHLPSNSPKYTNIQTSTNPVVLTEFKDITASPNHSAVTSIKKRYYKCSTCNTFHENWNLFLHIREQHNRHMCLYCMRFFPSAEKLALHLEIKHDLEQNHFNSEEALRNSIPVLEGYALESRLLMCCTCQHIFMESQQFSQHDCSEFIKPCPLCGQKGRHTIQCKAHPDSKRFSKLKKKKEKQIQPSEPLTSLPIASERSKVDSTVSSITISNHNSTPTIISNLNCDSGHAEKHQRPPTFNIMHCEDSNSSSNMVIDESCNISHIPPAQPQPHANSKSDTTLEIQLQNSSVRFEPDLPPDRQLTMEDEVPRSPPLKLVVPKFKLRVPKEFQKSVYDALSTSDSEEEGDVDNEEELNEQKNMHTIETEKDSAGKSVPDTETSIAKESVVAQNSLLAESTPANSQDMEIERNSATESATEAGNSQDDTAYEGGGNMSLKSALLLDDDDSLDEPNSNLVRIMQEIERTKLDIQRTKKTSIRHSKPFALPRQPTVSQSSNRTTDHNWSPTPPASPNSRWFTPRRSTISQSGEEQVQKTPQNQQSLLPPPSPVRQQDMTQKRRDTIGSDMMDIDETITSQPTQTIYRNQLLPVDNESLNTSIESIDEKSHNDPMETSQITQNEMPLSDIKNSELESEKCYKSPDHSQECENPQDINLSEKTQNMDITLTQSTELGNNERLYAKQDEEDEAEDDTEIDVCDNKDQEDQIQVTENEKSLELEKLPPADGIEVANDDCVIVDMKLDKPLDKYEVIDLVRICLKTVYPLCLYCNHARRIAVNGKSLVLHMIGNHRFTATVDSITAEELLPETIVAKLKSFLSELDEHFFNSNSYCTYGDGLYANHFNERIFECFQCRFVTSTHKELYLHNRKMHLRTAILCFMCRANFFSFSEILCHICPGVSNKVSVFDVKFRCCLCELDNIPSPFRLMVHLRKKHFACDVCLEDCRDQSKLSSHVWKHKLHHLCYRCGIAYRNKLDITKHLFWKHGTESTLCKRCLQKRWRHVYHFCIPPPTFVCEVCNLCFSKAMYLRVHKRLHSGDLRYPCIEESCEEKFISRKLLLKHAVVHQVLAPEALENEKVSETSLENKVNEIDITKDISEGDLKMQSGLKNMKQEALEIKKEPMDESELESRIESTEDSSKLDEKKLTDEEKVKITGVKDSKNEQTKEKKSSDPNKPHKKRKKSKRSKELLEDLNLTAPNLSESDSSEDSDSDSDAKTKSEIDSLPRVMLSPPSEAENEDKEDKSSEVVEPGQVLEIWKNFLKTQQGSSTAEELERLKAINEEKKQPKHIPVHVACSDHDYCKIEPEPPAPPTVPEPRIEAPKADFKKPGDELTSTPETSPTKRKQSKSPRRLSSRRSDASSSSSGSSSSSDSSCSCGSNCSCSSTDSNTSSSSSSSEDSDSSLASNNSVRKRHRKKSERDRMRKRSESMSPLKQHKLSVSNSDIIQVDDEDNAKETDKFSDRPPSPKEPSFYESDLETNESETDEEFYDEHPQKLANDLLAQKRAQLMAQTRLSPSHNYDIVENSRPSTPSLPEEVATNEKPKIKVKKKKRDRKSSCKGQGSHSTHVAVPEQSLAHMQTPDDVHQPINSMMQVPQSHSSNITSTFISSAVDSEHNQSTNLYTVPQTIYAPPPPAVTTEQTSLTPRPLTMPPYGHSHRMSEGSSCSDADGSLKRSKRQRRPNKFYGYTSDDENLFNGPPLMIGTRAFKPQPPPQLTWRKEDLPTPSKSVLNNKNKTTRTPKTPVTSGNIFGSTFSASSSKKKSRLSLTGEEKSARKRPAKKKDSKAENKFPPIPTLKIRPSQIGLNATINHSITKSGNYNTTDETSSDDDTSKGHFSSSTSYNSPAISQPLPPPIILPSQPPPPPTPQTTAFNHRIPPALLPNPDFATLQYFKANNIRYPIRPPAGARQPREGESVYCYCRCPYDEVSEMIACDGENCLIEWFHFECVGIMVAPQGKWFCAECRPKYSEELYPTTAAGQLGNV